MQRPVDVVGKNTGAVLEEVRPSCSRTNDGAICMITPVPALCSLARRMRHYAYANDGANEGANAEASAFFTRVKVLTGKFDVRPFYERTNVLGVLDRTFSLIESNFTPRFS